jgi:hypothetical protein
MAPAPMAPPIRVDPAPPRTPEPPRPAPRAAPASFALRVFAALVVLALLGQGAALVLVAHGLDRLEGAIDRTSATLADVARPLAPATAAQAPSSGAAGPAVAALGEGRVLYASADGKLVVLKRDAVSAELQVERVYALEQDDTRNGGDDAHRSYSGLYLTDVERSRREGIEIADAFYKDALLKAGDKADAFEKTLEAARRLADAGGFDRLARRLDDKTSLAGRSAAIALGERGFLIAIPALISMFVGTADSGEARKLLDLLRELTGLPLDPDDSRVVAGEKAQQWWKKNEPEDRWRRRVLAPKPTSR